MTSCTRSSVIGSFLSKNLSALCHRLSYTICTEAKGIIQEWWCTACRMRVEVEVPQAKSRTAGPKWEVPRIECEDDTI